MNVRGQLYAWIGLTTSADHRHCTSRSCKRHDWTWQDGTPYPGSYENWQDNEPEIYDKCVILSFHGWAGVQCPVDTMKYPFLCEKGNELSLL